MTIIIISILTIIAWTSIFKQTFSTKEGFKYRYYFARTLISSVDIKPFNCAYCLSFWTGLTLSIAFMDLSYMVIFLYFAKQD